MHYGVFAEYCRQMAIPIVTQDTFFKNLPQHIQVTDYRPRIQDRLHTFRGIRYSVSSVPNVSRLFYSLSSQRSVYENNGYEIEKISEDFIKLEVKVGQLGQVGHDLTCWICHKLISDGIYEKTDQGPSHFDCYQDLKNGKKEG